MYVQCNTFDTTEDSTKNVSVHARGILHRKPSSFHSSPSRDLRHAAEDFRRRPDEQLVVQGAALRLLHQAEPAQAAQIV